MQNLINLANTPVWPDVKQHISGKQLAKLFEDLLNVKRYDLYGDNRGLMEQMDTQRLMNAGQESIEAEAMTPIEGEEPL